LAKKDDLSVNINLGLELNKGEFQEAQSAIDKLKKAIDSANSMKLQIGGKPAPRRGFEEVLSKVVDPAQISGGKPSFKKIQVGLFKTIEDYGLNVAKVFSDDLNKGAALVALSPVSERFNAVVKEINEQILNSAKQLGVDINKEAKFEIVSERTIQELAKELEDGLSEMSNAAANEIRRVTEMLEKITSGIRLDPEEFNQLFDFSSATRTKATGRFVAGDTIVPEVGTKASKTLTISPAVFNQLADMIFEGLGEYMLGSYTPSKNFRGPVAGREAFGKTFEPSSEKGITNFETAISQRTKADQDKFEKAASTIVAQKLTDVLIASVKEFNRGVSSSADFKVAASEGSINAYMGSDQRKNLAHYDFEKFLEILRKREEGAGFLAGTTAVNIDQIMGESFALADPGMDVFQADIIKEWITAGLRNTSLAISTAFDSALDSPDFISPESIKKIALLSDPLQQAFEDPKIIRAGLTSEKESSVKSAITAMLKAYDQAISDEFARRSVAEYNSKPKELTAGRRILELTSGAPVSPTRLAPSVDPASLNLGQFGAAYPDIDKARAALAELSTEAAGLGKRLFAGMDTEHFNSKEVKDNITELGIVIENGKGELIDFYKFIQIPTDPSAMRASWEQLNKGAPNIARTQAKDVEGLRQRATDIGIPLKQIGSETDPEKNIRIAVAHYQKLVEILDLFAEYGVQLTGSTIEQADIKPVLKTIEYLNSISGEFGLEKIRQPNFGAPFDPATSASKSKLSDPYFAGVDVSEIFKDKDGKISGALGNLINQIALKKPEWLAQFEPQFTTKEFGTGGDRTFEYSPQGGGKGGAHFAISDSAASVIAMRFIEQFGSQEARNLLTPIAKNANVQLAKQAAVAGSGSGSGSGGSGPTAGKDEPGPMRDPSQLIKRILLSEQELAGALESIGKSVVQSDFVMRQRLQGLQGPLTRQDTDMPKSNFPVLQKMTAVEEKIFKERVGNSSEHLQVVTELAQKESELAAARKEMIDLSQGDMGFVLQQRRSGLQGPLTESQSSLVQSGGVERYDRQTESVIKLRKEISDLTRVGRENEIQIASGVVEETRKGQVTNQLTDNLSKQIDMQIASTQAGKSATAQIKAQMQEQVNSQKEAQKATQNLMNTWVTSRYALYDIGNFYTNIAQRLFGLSKQIFDTGQSFRRFETAFTSVERAMQLTRVGAKDLTEQFIKLSEEIPVTFEDISRIATLGAQMGINADGVIEFTRTVAEFSAITGMSAETVAQQFGRVAELADVDSTEYRNLGSAVAFAGINAVATEEEILKLAVGISAVSNQAGFSAKSIIGISTALASVAIPAEQARGVFTRVFAKMDRSVSQGTRAIEKLNDTTGMTKGEFNQYDKSAKQIEAFARMAGLSADEFSKAWGPNGQSEQVFYQMLQGLNATTDLTKAFDELGIVNVRDINTLTRLAANLDVVKQALEDAGIAFDQGIFLGEAFEKTVDNVDSKLIIFKNNVDSLAAAFSENLAGGFGRVLDVGSEIIKFLKGASSSIAAVVGLPIAIFFTAAAAGAAAFLAVTKKLTAQLLAFRVAMVNAANDPTATQGLAAQVKQLLGLSSGVMEVRDQVSGGFGQKGLVQPFATSGLITDQKKLQAELLKTNNVYFALGDRVKDTAYAAAQGASTATDFARLEADQIAQVVRARQLEIETLKQSSAASTVAGQQKIAQLTSQKIYVEFVDGEARALDEATFAEIRNAAASERTRGIKNGEAQARERNVVAVNAETSAAAKLGAGVGRVSMVLTRLLGWAGIIISIASAVNMLFTAIAKANEIDLIGSGGGLESLREAIAEDTRAFKENASSALTTARVEYKTYTTTVDKAAVAIAGIVGANNMAGTTFNKVTEDVRSQTVAIGENTKEWFANAIMKNEKLANWLDQDPEIFNKIQESVTGLGMSFDQVLKDMVLAAQGADIDPLKTLKEELSTVQLEYDKLQSRKFDASGPDVNAIPLSSDDLKRMDELDGKIMTLERAKGLFEEIGKALKQTFAQSALWNAIKDALDITEESNAILDLVDAFKEASDSGKGMEQVLEDVKGALISMMPVAIAANDELEFDLNSQPTIQGLIEIVQGLIDTKKAAFETAMALYKLQPFRDSRPIPTLDITEEEKSLRSLEALAVGAAFGLDKLGGAAESAADKLARFINEANSGLRTMLDFRSAIRSLGKSLEEDSSFSFDSAEGIANINAVLSVLESIGTKAQGNFPKAIREMQIFKLVLQDMGAPARAIKLIEKNIKQLGGSTNLTGKQAARLRKQFANLFNIFSRNMAAGAAELTNDVKDQVKTLTDFVSDLGSVLKTAFDVRYGKQIGLDAVSSAWISLKDAAEAAEKAVKSANDEINQSLADRSVLQYQLSVAERYKDEKRSVLIRAKLAKLDNQIIDQQKQLADANDANDKSLTGGSKAAIDNRAKVRDLVTQYNSYLIALANTNMTSTALVAEATKLENEFMAQAKSLGFAEEELKSYTAAFSGDFTKVINGLPRDITLTVNTDPALRAIQEFVAKAQAEIAKISVAPAPVASITPPGQKPTEQYFNLGLPNTRPGPEIDGKKGDIVTGPKGATWAWNNKNKEWDKIAKKAMGGYISGPGSPTSDSIPAMLSNGEYVIQARAVSAYGLDFMNALNQQRVGFNPMQGSSSMAGGGSAVVYLSPEDRALLRAAVDRPIALYTENTRIAQSANAGNVLLAQRGTN
jgi:TP901 family phage tail tape measure protein